MNRDRLLATLWTLAIAVGCAVPGAELPDMPALSFDKVIHVTVFAGFGWLWMRSLRPKPSRTAWVLATGIAFAFLTEVYQGLMPIGRSFDPYDILADIIGLIGAIWWIHHRSKEPSS